MLISVRNDDGPSFAACVAWPAMPIGPDRFFAGTRRSTMPRSISTISVAYFEFCFTDSTKAEGSERLVFWIFHFTSGLTPIIQCAGRPSIALNCGNIVTVRGHAGRESAARVFHRDRLAFAAANDIGQSVARMDGCAVHLEQQVALLQARGGGRHAFAHAANLNRVLAFPAGIAQTGFLIQERSDGGVEHVSRAFHGNGDRPVDAFDFACEDVFPVGIDVAIELDDLVARENACFRCRRIGDDVANHRAIVVDDLLERDHVEAGQNRDGQNDVHERPGGR